MERFYSVGAGGSFQDGLNEKDAAGTAAPLRNGFPCLRARSKTEKLAQLDRAETHHRLVADADYRNRAKASPDQLITCRGIVPDVPFNERNAVPRHKVHRRMASRSAVVGKDRYFLHTVLRLAPQVHPWQSRINLRSIRCRRRRRRISTVISDSFTSAFLVIGPHSRVDRTPIESSSPISRSENPSAFASFTNCRRSITSSE